MREAERVGVRERGWEGGKEGRKVGITIERKSEG